MRECTCNRPLCERCRKRRRRAGYVKMALTNLGWHCQPQGRDVRITPARRRALERQEAAFNRARDSWEILASKAYWP